MANELRRDAGLPTTGQIGALTMLRDVWREMVPTFRVLCFSELNDVAPMWSHYADQTMGVVLEFSAVDEVDSAFLTMRPVQYQSAPPSIADPISWVESMLGQRKTTLVDLLIEYQYTKSIEWSYEKEWRIASTKRPGESGLFDDYGFNPRELTGMYFGLRCSKQHRTDLIRLCAHGLDHIRVYEAILDHKKSKFSFRQIAV